MNVHEIAHDIVARKKCAKVLINKCIFTSAAYEPFKLVLVQLVIIRSHMLLEG